MHDFMDSNWAEACLQHRLEMESYLIETVLARYGQQRLAVTGGQVVENEVRYQIWTGDPTAVFPLRAGQSELSQKLGLPVKLSRHQSGLMARVTKQQPPVALMGLMEQFGLPPQGMATAVVGLDARGRTVDLDCGHDGHVLIAGKHGSGKSSLLRNIILTLALTNRANDVQFLLIQDAHSSDLISFNYLPDGYLLHPVIGQGQNSVRVLQRLADKMVYPANGRWHPQIIVIIDNINALLAKHGIDLLAPLTRLLITRGITIIMSTAQPEDPIFSYINDSIRTRLVGKVNTIEQARAATGKPISQAERLLGQGDFLQITANHTPRYFQAAYHDQYELSFLLLRLRQNQGAPFTPAPTIPKPIWSNLIQTQ